MLLIRISSKKVLEISEYYILIPLMLAIELAIARKLKKNRSQNNDKSKQFKKWKIFYFAMGRLRGGNEITQFLDDYYLDVKHLDCILKPGIQYLDNARLRKIVNYLFHDKVKNGVIFITRTALCHIASEYGLYQLDLPIPIHSPVAVTSRILLLQKTIVSGFIVSPAAIITLLGTTNVGLIASAISFLVGLTTLALTKDGGLAVIATQAYRGPISSLKPRISNQVEVVSIDVQPNDYTIVKNQLAPSYECSLPDQRIGNPKCARHNIIIDIVNNDESVDVILDKIIDYDQVVNMEDITGLRGDIKFADQFETVPLEKPGPIKSQHSRPNLRKNLRRTANLLDKYGDPENVPDTQTWDTSPNTKHNIRNQ